MMVAMLAGCGKIEQAAPGVEGRAAQAGQPTYTVVGIDRTAGPGMTRDGLAIARAYVLAAKPCDRLTLRWISDKSFVASEVIGELRVPCLPNKAATFDAAATRRYKEAELTAKRSRSDAAAALDALAARNLPATRSTDLVGFVAAAAASLGEEQQAQRRLVIISDFDDNAKRSATVDLSGVSVTMHLVGAQADPARAQALTGGWATALAQMGAGAAQVRSGPPAP
jgi:hypothetical protein